MTKFREDGYPLYSRILQRYDTPWCTSSVKSDMFLLWFPTHFDTVSQYQLSRLVVLHSLMKLDPKQKSMNDLYQVDLDEKICNLRNWILHHYVWRFIIHNKDIFLIDLSSRAKNISPRLDLNRVIIRILYRHNLMGPLLDVVMLTLIDETFWNRSANIQ